MSQRVSLAQQLEAVEFAVIRQGTLAQVGSVKGMRGRSVEEFDLARLRAAARTLEWLLAHEEEIRAFLAVPSTTAREAAVAMAGTIQRREAAAAAGGPKR